MISVLFLLVRLLSRPYSKKYVSQVIFGKAVSQYLTNSNLFVLRQHFPCLISRFLKSFRFRNQRTELTLMT